MSSPQLKVSEPVRPVGKKEGPEWEESYIDPTLHEITLKHVRLGVDTVLGEEAQKRSILSPQTTPGIHLSVRDFAQAPMYRYFMYGVDQPEMIVCDHCFVCDSPMIAASCLTNRRGKQFLTLGLCPQCGFFQHIRRPPKEWYATFYRKMWDPNTRQQTPDEVPLRRETVDNLYGFARPGQRVLEIGSGWGSCLLTLQQAGFQAYGIEATEHRSAFIREKLNIPCFTGEAEDVPIGKDFFIPKSFDVIFSTNVLEHVYNTRKVLEHVYVLLKDNGLAYLEVPVYYQENLTMNTHGVAHTCNFSHPNFFYLLQTIGFDLVKDFSDPVMVRLLVRKAPPITEEQKKSKKEWMSHFLPHRGLAYVLEKNGLSRMPEQRTINDSSLNLEWFLNAPMQGEMRFLQLRFDFLKQFVDPLNQLREIVRKRKPLELASSVLPIQYVYPGDDVPIWYY